MQITVKMHSHVISLNIKQQLQSKAWDKCQKFYESCNLDYWNSASCVISSYKYFHINVILKDVLPLEPSFKQQKWSVNSSKVDTNLEFSNPSPENIPVPVGKVGLVQQEAQKQCL